MPKPFGSMLAALLTACGGGGGDDGCTLNPAPSISGSPPLTATVGVQYTASFEASYNCHVILICDALSIVQGPAQAGAFHDMVFWTPSSDQADRTHVFMVATAMPDLCGRTAQRSWSVTVTSNN